MEKNSEATFITAQRTWSTAESGNLANTFAGWSLEDFQNYGWDQGKEMNEAYFNYLTKVELGLIAPECSELTRELAMDLKMAFFSNYDLRLDVLGSAPAFEFSGNENFSNYADGYKYLEGCDFSNCTGLSLEQFYDFSVRWSVLPSIQISGNEDFSRLDMDGVDLTPLKGLTIGQILKFGTVSVAETPWLKNIQLDGSEDFSNFGVYGDISGWKGITKDQCLQALSTGKVNFGASVGESFWPEITFDGTEDFSKANFYSFDFNVNIKGITANQITSSANLQYAVLPNLDFSNGTGFTQNIRGADLTRYIGLTADQITTAKNWDGIRITQAQYDAMKTGLAESLAHGKSYKVYVDGKSTTIRSSN